MKKKPRLILLYGFAGIGKTTLAKRMNADIPLSLCIEVDQLLTMIGQWLPNETVAREYVFLMTTSLIETYLKIGKDVILPYLLTDKNQATEFEKIAKTLNVQFIELFIKTNKADSIRYLYERGTWGEAGSPAITENDLPHIETIYDDMDTAMKTRISCIEVPYIRGDIEQTYRVLNDRLFSTSFI